MRLTNLWVAAALSVFVPAAATLAQTAAPAATAPVTVRGVTDDEIRFGMIAPFSGPTRNYGPQMKVGIVAAFNSVNDAGGIAGRKLKLITADDGFDPSKTPEAVKTLTERDPVFAMVANFGAPTTAVALPLLLQRRMILFAPFVGSNLVRRDPPDRYVFTYRPSVAQECIAVTQYLMKVKRLKPEQIAFFGQGDAYGDSGFDGVMRAVRAVNPNAEPPRILHMTNTPGPSIDVEAAANQLLQYQRQRYVSGIKAVVTIGTTRHTAKFIEKTHDTVPGLIYTAGSGVGASAFADELMLLGPKFAAGVVVTQTVPAVDGFSSVVLDYKTALSKYFPEETPNATSLEAYLSMQVLIEALRRADPAVDTEKLVDALDNLRNFDLGIGVTVNFDRNNHQAVHKVWGTQLDGNGHYQPIDLD